MTYTSHTDAERREMLETIGLEKIEDLFADIPKKMRASALELDGPLSETEVRREFARIADGNCDMTCSLFLGAGSYHHFIPAALSHLVMRSEFYTAYTPYQAEASQGMLQSIYEYQSMMCELTGMDVSNASMYDGATALYEAAIMAMRCARKRTRIIVDECINPLYRNVLATYAGNLDLELVHVPAKDGHTDVEAIAATLDDKTAAVLVSNPNFFGVVQDFSELAGKVHEYKALLVMSVNPVALGALKTPGEMGADIVTGEAQPFRSPMFFGGPYIGFMTTREKYVRKMPGRIISETVDEDGERGFVMTLQTREQHIRREKATSNICTNQGLLSLTVAVYLSLIGRDGFTALAEQNISKAAYAKKALTKVEGVSLKWKSPAFNEFVLSLPQDAEKVIENLTAEEKIVGGLPLKRYYEGMDNDVLVCVTEMNTREQIDEYAAALGRLI
ncbi:MAG: aminomethyl-transferring glycine dehydrogenase subunit GcvPA [Planctomycetota bacterium]|nr:aminomethyl-transferring glycine dehydrogenase subunit GcvPA [Planctomycetota bacterium]